MRPDPQAGHAWHEIGERALWSVLSKLPFLLVIWFEWMPRWLDQELMTCFLAAAVWLGGTEGLVRRSWRWGLAGFVLVLANLLLVAWILGWDVDLSEGVYLYATAFTTAGLLAGLSSRSLLAAFLGLLSGPASVLAIWSFIRWFDYFVNVNAHLSEEVIILLGILTFAVLQPVFAGLAVWAGHRWARRYGSNPPGAPAAPSV